MKNGGGLGRAAATVTAGIGNVDDNDETNWKETNWTLSSCLNNLDALQVQCVLHFDSFLCRPLENHNMRLPISTRFVENVSSVYDGNFTFLFLYFTSWNNREKITKTRAITFRNDLFVAVAGRRRCLTPDSGMKLILMSQSRTDSIFVLTVFGNFKRISC